MKKRGPKHERTALAKTRRRRMHADPRVTMLDEAESWVTLHMDDAGGVECPCCKQLAKVYKRKLNASMARALIRLYWEIPDDKWVHVPTHGTLSRLGGDWGRLVHWGLIEEKLETKEDGNPHAGFWRVTPRGRDFVTAKLRVPACVFLYDAEQIPRESEETVSIQEALGKRFDYAEIMASARVSTTIVEEWAR